VIGEIEAQLAQYRGTDVPWSAARVMDPPVRRNIKLAEAPSFGMTIFDYAPRCPGAGDYRELARGLLERWGMPCDLFDGVASPRAAEVGGEGAPATAKRRRTRKARAAKPRAAKVRTAKPRAAKARLAKAAAAPKAKAAKKVKPVKKAKASKPSKAGKTAKAAKPSKPAKPAKSPTRAKKPKPGRRAAPARRGPIRSGGLSL